MLFVGSRDNALRHDLTIAVPQLLALHDPKERALDDARHHDPPGEIDEHDGRGERPENVANVAVVAVDDPSGLGHESSNLCPKLLKVERRPVGLLVEPVEFEMGHAEGRRRSPRPGWSCRFPTPPERPRATADLSSPHVHRTSTQPTNHVVRGDGHAAPLATIHVPP